MFDFIDNIGYTVFFMAVFLIGIISVVAYSRYEAHRKVHIADAKDGTSYQLANKFAVVPYLIVPLIFGAIAVISALTITDIAAARGYIAGTEITVAAVALTVIMWMMADKLLVSHCGDAVYFDTIEDKVFQTTDQILQTATGDASELAAYGVPKNIIAKYKQK